jgi:hypothetical protein
MVSTVLLLTDVLIGRRRADYHDHIEQRDIYVDYIFRHIVKSSVVVDLTRNQRTTILATEPEVWGRRLCIR